MKAIKINIVCVVLALILTGCGQSSNTNINNDKASQKAQQEDKTQYIMAGKVECDTESNIASKISGKVLEMPVDIGTSVNEGDTIIKLDTQDLEAQVNSAEAALNTAKATLTNAENSVRPEQISQAQAALDNAKESYDVAQKNYDRVKAVYDVGGSTTQALDGVEQQLVAADTQQKSAEEQLNILKNGPTEESIAVYEAQVSQSEAAVKTAETALKNGTIAAPISGTVTSKNIRIGDMAAPNATLLTISNPTALVVTINAPIDVVSNLKEGQSVAVKVSELENQVFNGKITIINTKLNTQSRNVLVKVAISDPNEKLQPGMIAEVGIIK